VDPDRVHISEAVAPGDAHRPQADGPAELPAAGKLREQLDSGVVAPLVHHEQALGCKSGEPTRLGEVGSKGLLDEDRHISAQKSLRDLCVRDRRRRNDARRDLRQLAD
jgi:hypothetical protein